MERVSLIITSNISKSIVCNSMIRLIQKEDMMKWLDGDDLTTTGTVSAENCEKFPAKILYYKGMLEIHLSTQVTPKGIGYLESRVYQLTGRRYPDKQFDYIIVEYGCHMKSNLREYIVKREDN